MQSSRTDRKTWELDAFLDSLVVELDKVRDTLAIKGVNRPLTYGVKELSFDLQIFPDFDGRTVRFKTAAPGEKGASRISFQLGSITREQIRRTTTDPITREDIRIDDIPELDDDARDRLQKIGVNRISDFEKLERKNVDMDRMVREPAKDKKSSFKRLADIIRKARRGTSRPSVSGLSLMQGGECCLVRLSGSNLVQSDTEGFPIAAMSGQRLEVRDASDGEIILEVPREMLNAPQQKLEVVLDPYAAIKMNINIPSELSGDEEGEEDFDE